MTLAFVMRKGGKTPWDIFVLLEKQTHIHMQAHAHTQTTFTQTHSDIHTHKPQYQTLFYINVTQETQNEAKSQMRGKSRTCVGLIMKYLSLVSVNEL